MKTSAVIRHATELSAILGAPHAVHSREIVWTTHNEVVTLHIGEEDFHLEINYPDCLTQITTLEHPEIWSRVCRAMCHALRYHTNVSLKDQDAAVSFVCYESDLDRAKEAVKLLKDVADGNPTLRDAIDHVLVLMSILSKDSD